MRACRNKSDSRLVFDNKGCFEATFNSLSALMGDIEEVDPLQAACSVLEMSNDKSVNGFGCSSNVLTYLLYFLVVELGDKEQRRRMLSSTEFQALEDIIAEHDAKMSAYLQRVNLECLCGVPVYHWTVTGERSSFAMLENVVGRSHMVSVNNGSVKVTALDVKNLQRILLMCSYKAYVHQVAVDIIESGKVTTVCPVRDGLYINLRTYVEQECEEEINNTWQTLERWRRKIAL